MQKKQHFLTTLLWKEKFVPFLVFVYKDHCYVKIQPLSSVCSFEAGLNPMTFILKLNNADLDTCLQTQLLPLLREIVSGNGNDNGLLFQHLLNFYFL